MKNTQFYEETKKCKLKQGEAIFTDPINKILEPDWPQ